MAYRDREYDDMEYRELGRTGLTVSAVGMGCEGFEGKTQEESGKLMGAAMDEMLTRLDEKIKRYEAAVRTGHLPDGCCEA